jgi:1-acyl-sn-glycerol-3-phosphate acyltransferase
MGTPERLLRWFGIAERVHRYEIHGFEHVPRSGPALLVSHHAYVVLDMFLLAKRIYERDGRVPRGLTDHRVFKIPALRDLFVTLGVVDGTPANAQALLDSGQLAACMPGGALEWSRSWRQRRRLRWADHRGYARMAVRAGVPVIPTACPAADDLYLVLNDGWKLAERLRAVAGIRRAFPVTAGIGLGVLPFPVKLTQYVLEPQWPSGEGDEDTQARELDGRVRRLLEEVLQRP